MVDFRSRSHSEFSLKLTHFLLHLLPHLLGLLPVKAHTSGLFLDSHGLDQRRQTFRHPTKDRDISLLGQLDFLPILLDGLLVLRHCIPVDVGVSTDQFLAKGVNHRSDVVVTLLRTDFGIKDQVQEQVSHLFLDFLRIAFQDGIRKFKGLLNGQVAQTFGGLLFVPGTLRTQLIHDGQ